MSSALVAKVATILLNINPAVIRLVITVVLLVSPFEALSQTCPLGSSGGGTGC